MGHAPTIYENLRNVSQVLCCSDTTAEEQIDGSLTDIQNIKYPKTVTRVWIFLKLSVLQCYSPVSLHMELPFPPLHIVPQGNHSLSRLSFQAEIQEYT